MQSTLGLGAGQAILAVEVRLAAHVGSAFQKQFANYVDEQHPNFRYPSEIF